MLIISNQITQNNVKLATLKLKIMKDGIYEKGDKVITKDGEGVVHKDQMTKDGEIEVKLNTGESNTYAPADVSDDSDAG